MTHEEKDAIRKRADEHQTALGWNCIPASYPGHPYPLVIDVRTLLAEVERLEAAIDGFETMNARVRICEGCGHAFETLVGKRFCAPSCQLQAEAETTSYAQRFREKMNKPTDPSGSKLE